MTCIGRSVFGRRFHNVKTIAYCEILATALLCCPAQGRAAAPSETPPDAPTTATDQEDPCDEHQCQPARLLRRHPALRPSVGRLCRPRRGSRDRSRRDRGAPRRGPARRLPDPAGCGCPALPDPADDRRQGLRPPRRLRLERGGLRLAGHAGPHQHRHGSGSPRARLLQRDVPGPLAGGDGHPHGQGRDDPLPRAPRPARASVRRDPRPPRPRRPAWAGPALRDVGCAAASRASSSR